jgi:uncharacterized heparinase superfamily protein
MRSISMLQPTQFRFLNHSQSLPQLGGWNDATLDKLWLYNLHYFDDLNAFDASARMQWHQALIVRWLAENAPTGGNGWEPYPTSLRIVNWVKWLATGNTPVPGMLDSLVLQASWLAKRLEWHLLGNHLFANAKALVFAGLLFQGELAADWRELGLKIISRELVEQVLADGGNFERSPMYHAIFLEDVLDLVNAATYWPELVTTVQVSQWRDKARSMLNWLDGMTHPDGEIALFNDAALGVAPKSSELRSYANRLNIKTDDGAITWQHKLLHFSDSGYVRLQERQAVAFLDVAPIGPDYLPGHAHADTLSFELSVFDQRVVVNGGTSRYGLGPERLRERSTAAHSTVEVAGQNSSEVWSGFRVARRAYPFDLQVRDESIQMLVACSHSGYQRLQGSPVHRREWVMTEDSLQIIDSVSGGQHAALARYVLHPSVTVATSADGKEWRLTLPEGQALNVAILKGTARIEAASYAPEFGVVVPTKCLIVELVHGEAQAEWLWS